MLVSTTINLAQSTRQPASQPASQPHIHCTLHSLLCIISVVDTRFLTRHTQAHICNKPNKHRPLNGGHSIDTTSHSHRSVCHLPRCFTEVLYFRARDRHSHLDGTRVCALSCNCCGCRELNFM